MTWHRKGWKCELPAGEYGTGGRIRITDMKVTPDIHEHLLAATAFSDRVPLPGDYKRLDVDGTLWMSDTPAEYFDQQECIERAIDADGPVLLMGLGMGCLAATILENTERAYIWAVERDREVAELVGSHLRERYPDRFNWMLGDAFQVQPADLADHPWAVVYHDVWATISDDHLWQMDLLEQRWRHACGWTGCWSRNGALHMKSMIDRAHEGTLDPEEALIFLARMRAGMG